MGNMKTFTAVTGAASGLGREIATALLTRGRPVILLDRDADALAATNVDLAPRHDVPISQIVADLSTLDGVETAAEQLLAHSGLGALVNNVGGWTPGDQYPQALPEAWLPTLTMNLVAPMLLTQRVWASLAAVAGAVVNIGSSGGIGDAAYGSPEYGAAKAGIHRFTASLAARSDVRVMAVIPGWIGLERAHREWATLSDEQRLEAGPLIPPPAIAARVVDLLTDGQPGEVVEMLR